MTNSSENRWEGTYFGGPCIGNVPYSFEVSYNQAQIGGYSSSTKIKTDPEVGDHVLFFRQIEEECQITLGKTFRVRSPVDVIDNNLSDGECGTAEESEAAGACTLRAAVMQANVSPGHERIEVGRGTYELTLEGDEAEDAANAAIGDLDITDSATITGDLSGPRRVTIDAGGRSRIFDIHTSVDDHPVVRLSGLRLTNGRESNFPGGAIWNRGSLQVRRVVIEGNQLSGGEGTCAASFSQFPCNRGAGILNQGALLLSESTISDNQTGEGGTSGHAGALSNFGERAIAYIEKSLIVRNRSRYFSALQNYLGSMDIVNTTITGNVEHGGSVISNQGGQILIRHSTLALNTTTGGRVPLLGNRDVTSDSSTFVGTFRVAGSLIETRNDLLLCGGNVISGGFNVIRPAGRSGNIGLCSFSGLSSSDHIASEFLSFSLDDNGGPTETIGINASGDFRYIDLGSLYCPTEDQRGAIRPVDGDEDGSAHCDPGAFEYNPAGFVRR
ncbi:MAG: choice-of-anchor Q domain-containing protein [Nitrospirales bacterium]